MDSQKVDMFIMTYGKFFESHQIIGVRESLKNADESKWAIVQSISFKDPTTSLIVSLLGGTLGIDRFFLGDTGLGIGKLVTCGGFGIWTLIDWFLIMGAAKGKNLSKLMQALA
ncbi:NINE protein [Labilibaculum sp. A4]|uniref:NINE protein n=1 Tax=Labilibaculum euxinus TaxID=2686357 RepID=A0A425YC02_9BACT|nr:MULTISPECIES: TM2 domain-containing protein [Labilibaculum]MDM8158409.1 TM2 domain-containing protein [Labilibaculum sp. K2S]MDQ1772681.1 TM2 domain-containing protein [Labilibaculum euxinus]MUP39215.1 NINE protein [Labilibaculum euxinus]MVB08420.1 NINE protein [Labilibaculum euxinus]MWN76741.1 NINE protein [Labilibaculum euxinus]